MESKSKSRWISEQSITPHLCRCQLKRLLCTSALQLGERFITRSSISSQLPTVRVRTFECDTLGGRFRCASTRTRPARCLTSTCPALMDLRETGTSPGGIPLPTCGWVLNGEETPRFFTIHCLWPFPFYCNIIILPVWFFFFKVANLINLPSL